MEECSIIIEKCLTIVEECPICLMVIDNNSYTTKCCKKNFHTICYINCMKLKAECPLCRQPQLEVVIIVNESFKRLHIIIFITITSIFTTIFCYYLFKI